jgi:hypothetical protein
MSTSVPPEGPYLYDEDPERLHTGVPRRRRGLIFGILISTLAVAIAAVVALPLLTGSQEQQSREVSGVFLKALAAGDTETAYGLLCDAERRRVKPADLGAAYLGPGTGSVVGATADHRHGKPVELIRVRWGDGSTSTFTMVSEGGARVCGTSHPVG